MLTITTCLQCQGPTHVEESEEEPDDVPASAIPAKPTPSAQAKAGKQKKKKKKKGKGDAAEGAEPAGPAEEEVDIDQLLTELNITPVCWLPVLQQTMCKSCSQQYLCLPTIFLNRVSVSAWPSL